MLRASTGCTPRRCCSRTRTWPTARRYLNARSTLNSLLALGVIPIINENDTVVVDEIRFGDNDTLGALVTNLIEADALVILTDQKGLYSADPRKIPDARLVERGAAGDPALEAMAGGAGIAPRQRRHAHQGARRQARGAQRRPHRDRLGARARRAGEALFGRIRGHAARRGHRPGLPRANNGSRTI